MTTIAAVFFSLHTGSFSTNVIKKAENKAISLCKIRYMYKPHLPEIYGIVIGTCKCCFYKTLPLSCVKTPRESTPLRHV